MLSENIFSQQNIYKLPYYHYTLPRNSRSLTEETGVQLARACSGVLHLWEQTPLASLCIVSRLHAKVKVVV
jgi:hypothetical protein